MVVNVLSSGLMAVCRGRAGVAGFLMETGTMDAAGGTCVGCSALRCGMQRAALALAACCDG